MDIKKVNGALKNVSKVEAISSRKVSKESKGGNQGDGISTEDKIRYDGASTETRVKSMVSRGDGWLESPEDRNAKAVLGILLAAAGVVIGLPAAVAKAILDLPKEVFRSLKVKARKLKNRLTNTDYRKELESFLFKENELSYDNFEGFHKKLEENPDVAKKLLKLITNRKDQLENYDNKSADLSPEKGTIWLKDKANNTAERFDKDSNFYLYLNKDKKVAITMTSLEGGPMIQIYSYKPLNDNEADLKMIEIHYTNEGKVGSMLNNVVEFPANKEQVSLFLGGYPIDSW